ncbi:cop9 signalosome complex subunit 2 [Trichoderma arundinaceum]|uniref:COP9 signalosome complex subunit 2 n=1 Tax=Trichoderma arundinaceum TaxID=490622 RepID=A0A395NJ13_TRIAR|nr:cop9 signalosome complex subunit 2 [Trichoderma arundinaceum]
MTRYATEAETEPSGMGSDVEANADRYRIGEEDYDADEETALLQNTDLPPDIAPSKAFRRLVLGMCVLFLFIVEVSQYILTPPTEQIMEDVICRRYHPDHALVMPRIHDSRCKETDVQKTLAMVRSWSMSGEMMFPLLVQISFGVVADKYGRRLVMFLALFGCFLQQTWVIIVLLFPDTFSIWSMLYGSVFYLIGGGGQMVVAMIWTIIADVIPVAERTSVFYRIYAMNLIISVAVNPVAAWLLSIDPWLAMWIGYGVLTLGMLSSALIPETLKLRQAADNKRRGQDALPSAEDELQSSSRKLPGAKELMHRAWFSAKNDVSHVWHFIFASKSVLLLLFAYGPFYLIKLAFVLDILQYMTRRFNWEWSTATYVNTVSSLTAVFTLLVALPLASSILTKRFRFNPISRDLFLARASIIVFTVGSLLTALAGVPWLFICAMAITNLGGGLSSLTRALLNAVVEPHTIATLNTTMSTMETLMGFIGSPVMGWLLSRGMELGGVWMGLPYIATTLLGLGPQRPASCHLQRGSTEALDFKIRQQQHNEPHLSYNRAAMSDDEDFMQESDEEQYDFEYEEDDEEEAGDVDIENKYYNAKQLKLSDPKDAIAEFLGIPPLEPEKGEWGFKGLKQAIKLEFKLGQYDDAADHFAELLTYVKSAVTRNYSEKSINNMLDYIEKGADESAAVKSMEKFYSLTLQSFQSTNNERLWLKTNIKLAKLLLDRKEYSAVSKKLRELHRACQRSDGSDDPGKGTYSLEIYALEIQMLAETRNNKQLKTLYNRALKVKSAVPHPRIMGIIRECGGKMHMSEENWKEAQSDFFESFRNYDEAGSLQRIQVLKYLLLTTMLMKSNINPFDSQETKPYKTDPRISAMTELVDAYQRDDVHAYEKALRNNQDILADPFIAENIDEVTRNMRTKGVLKLIAPYTRMKLSWIAKQLRISEPEVQDILSFLIIDGKIKGSVNQQAGILEIVSDADISRIQALDSLTSSIHELFGAVFKEGEGYRNELSFEDSPPGLDVQGLTSLAKARGSQGQRQLHRSGKGKSALTTAL